MSLGALIVQMLGGLATAAVLFLVAAGITLMFGALRIINIAHGSFYMYGAFISASAVSIAVPESISFWIRLAISAIACALLGAGMEVLILRRLYRLEHLSQLLATFAVFFILADVAQQIWGSNYRNVKAPPVLQGQISFLDYSFPAYSLFVIGVALASGLMLSYLLQRTAFGWKVRAAVEDPELLAGAGTNVGLLFTAVVALSTALAGLAGAVVAPMQAVAPGMDSNILVAAFIVAIVGGLGSIAGAAIGAVLIGVFQAFGLIWFPQWSSVIIYVVMIAVLIVRPNGILGYATR